MHDSCHWQEWVGHTTKQLLIFQLDCLFNNLGGLRPPRWLNKTVLLNRSITITYYPDISNTLRPDFTSQLVHGLAFGIPKFYIAPYDKINHGLVNLSSNCDVKSGLKVDKATEPDGISQRMLKRLFFIISHSFMFAI